MQARLNSTRLPAKAMLPIVDGKVSLLLAMQGIYGVAQHHLLACDEVSFATFAPLAKVAGYSIMAGSAEDVLARFAQAAGSYDVPYIIRATADNLIVGSKLVEHALVAAMASDADYFCFAETPHGSGVEVMKRTALLQAAAEATLPSDREHVSAYIYQHPDLFKIERPVAPAWMHAPQLRSTLDTAQDYERLCAFFKQRSKDDLSIVEEYIAWMQE